MIGKITIGKSFSGCIKYCLEDKIQKQNQEPVFKNRAEVLMYNKCYGDTKELVQQFNEVRQLNTKLSKPVLHITLSLAPGESLAKDKLMEMCEQCAREVGFENNQFIAVSHRDTTHQHLHLVANRIGFDNRTVSDSNNYQKIANYCRKMELKYDLKQVLSPKRYLPKEQRNLPRFDQRKEQLRHNIKEALTRCSNFTEFEVKMKLKGYEITKGRGISFTDEKKVKVKGSELNYSLQTIERAIEKQNAIQSLISKTHSMVGYASIPGNERSNTSASNNLLLNQDSLSKVIDLVMKPELNQEGVNKQFLQKKRKKKRLHL